MNKQIKQMLILPVIIWMIIIFKFSNEPATVSGNTSSNVTKIIVSIFTSKDITEEQKNELIEKLDPMIRKLAHFSLYTIGGILILLYINIYKLEESKKIVYSIAIGSIYSCTDEIHQIFIPGRSGEFTDVMLDSIGIATGVCICLTIIKVINKIFINNCKKRA